MPDLSDRHDATQRARALFAYDHLPPHLAELSAKFAQLADDIIDAVVDDAMLREALLKLWEAKNCAVYVAARIGMAPEAISTPERGFSPHPAHSRKL